MTVHIFNPGHDLALASGLRNFTPPHAARQLSSDLGWIPALWAKDGDAVIVEDKAYATRRFDIFFSRQWKKARKNIEFIQLKRGGTHDIPSPSLSFDPWGWDTALKDRLMRLGFSPALLPSDEHLTVVRRLSNRSLAVGMLSKLTATVPSTVGESVVATSAEQTEEICRSWENAVLKSPWSCSGRGIRFLTPATPYAFHEKWIRSTLQNQQSIIVEKMCRKVMDFGMEFTARRDATVAFDGLSLFLTTHGAYTGNIIATETRKQQMLSRYVSPESLSGVAEAVCSLLSETLAGRYEGPLGVDMMVVAREDGRGFLINPCIEINLRRTMGHAALALQPSDDDLAYLFRLRKSDRFRISINRI